MPIKPAQYVDLENNNGKRLSLSSAGSNSGGGSAVAIPLTVKSLEEENRRKSAMILQAGNGVGTVDETWDYVYRQLENIGYTKDQGERPDVLALLNKVSMARQKTAAAAAASGELAARNLSPQALSPLSYEEKELLRQIQDTHISGDDEIDGVHRRLRKSSGSDGHHARKHREDKNKSASSGKSSDNHKGSRNKSLRHSRPLSPPTPQKTKNSNRWHCRACTFSNKIKFDICEMCGKSRDSPDFGGSAAADDESDRASSGSKTTTVACKKCTLVNDRKLKVCQACGASLHKKKIPMEDAAESGGE